MPMSTREEPNWVTDRRHAELVCVVVECETEPDRCTIYPRGAAESLQSDRWLSATGDAFVAPADAR
jgi:sorbitol-specific phosphotransferase system component IIBC